MARRLILDTGVLVSWERPQAQVSAALEPADDIAIAAITLAELRAGVELASELHQSSRTAFLQAVVEVFPVESYDEATADVHGRLLAHTHRSGTRRGALDLIIAATAVATRRTLLTTDKRARFDELPGVDCVVLD